MSLATIDPPIKAKEDTRWWCYMCKQKVDIMHITQVLSMVRRTGRCPYPNKKPEGSATK